MNETVIIKEGGLTRRLAPIDKLKINTTDNKESTWVPDDKSKIGVLHASENGIYIASEDGYEAYSEVIVRVTKDSFEGDTSFDDWDYETPDMDLSNWDPETIEEFENDPEAFDDIFNDEDEWKDIDKPIDIKMNNPKIKDIKISGVDPISGNDMEVGLDEDGYLTESTLPSRIEIVRLPSKLTYKDGEKILFNLVVKAYTADGNIWTGESELGVLKTRNLTFPITIASISHEAPSEGETDPSEGEGIYYEGGGTFYVCYQEDGTGGTMAVPSGARFCIIMDQSKSKLWCCIASENPFTAHQSTISGDMPDEERDITGSAQLYNDKIYYLGVTQPWQYPIPTSALNYNIGSPTDALRIMFGNESAKITQDIPVQYIRSDGEILEDSFTIEVIYNSDDPISQPEQDGHSSSGSSHIGGDF